MAAVGNSIVLMQKGETMSDYIERENAKHAVWGCTRDTGIDEAPFEYAEGLLENVPSADVAPVRHGRWIDMNTPTENYFPRYKCSVCGHGSDFSNFCPNCGARMDEEVED